MKIALELQPCACQMSGIGVYTYELAKRMNSSTDISYVGNVFNFLNRNCCNAIGKLNMSISYNYLMPYGIYRRIWNEVPIPYRFLFNNHAEITHFFNYIVPPKVSGKVITTIHDMSYKYYPETLNPKNLRRIQNDIQYSVNRSDLIITISQNSKKEILEEFSLPENKVKIIYPSFGFIENDTDSQAAKLKYKLKKKYILYVGNLEPRKNIDRLVLAYAKLKREMDIPYQLVIAGQKGWLYDKIFETVTSHNLQNDIIFTGYISESDKTALYKNASLFVYPSLYEGFGIPILEAMHSEVPVVCSKTSSMPEVAGEAAIFIDPLDVYNIANGIYTLLSNQLLRKSKIALGKKQAEKFSWDKSAEDLANIYRSMM